MSSEIVESQMALALGRPQIARGQKPAEPAIGGAVLGIGENVGRAVDEDQPRAGDDAQRADRSAVLARDRHARARRRRACCDRRSRSPPARVRRRARPALRDAKRRAETKNSSSSQARRSAGRGGSSSLLPLAGEGGRAKRGRMRGRAARRSEPALARRPLTPDPSPARGEGIFDQSRPQETPSPLAGEGGRAKRGRMRGRAARRSEAALARRPLTPDPSPARGEGDIAPQPHHGRPHRARIVSTTFAPSRRTS